jgi:hypothetical protein
VIFCSSQHRWLALIYAAGVSSSSKVSLGVDDGSVAV